MNNDQPKVDNLLHISWCDSHWVPHLNAGNIMEYFSDRGNPFYDRNCSNEFIKMQQNARLDALNQMQGVEYMLLHAQEPILYIIRKQQRFSPTQVQPMASYHIIGGNIYQTPDVGSIINSRLASATAALNSSFSELASYSNYHPTKGYSWQFKNKDKEDGKKAKPPAPEEEATPFQRLRVESLLGDWANKFPAIMQPEVPPAVAGPSSEHPSPVKIEEMKPEEGSSDIKPEVKQEIKQETKPETRNGTKPPPEKRPRYS